MKHILLILLLLMTLPSYAAGWTIEAEDPASTVTWKGGTATIHAPKGLTLWYDQRMDGNVVIEYEARITSARTSDLNCFWMADRRVKTSGRFVDYYAMQMYYMGYGGNYNSTTRFRRYTGDARGIDSAEYRPPVLREYTDAQHLLKKGHWYKIRLEQIDGHVRYIIDGQCLVDYVDVSPLRSGYFGFRTTLATAQMRNFRYTCTRPDDDAVVLKWVGGRGEGPVTFGVPFDKGEKTDHHFSIVTSTGQPLPFDTWRLASWPDGSAKWQAFSTVVPAGVNSCLLMRSGMSPQIDVQEFPEMPTFTVTLNHRTTPVLSHVIERQGTMSMVHRYTGNNFIIRAYLYRGSPKIRLVHTLLVDSALESQGLSELSLHFRVPMHGPSYERYVQYDDRRLSVQPLIARRRIDLTTMDSVTQSMIRNIAQWDGFRLTQLTPNAYSIRKRTGSLSPWIGTMEGRRSDGTVTVGDSTSCMSFTLKDFWQSCPSSLQVDGARSDTADVCISLYAPEAEAFSFAHYDTIAHTLDASYEDVQPGLSTAVGIARTSEIYVNVGMPASRRVASDGCRDDVCQLLPTPEYLHRKRAFGIWSLPRLDSPRDSLVERTLDGVMDFYRDEIDRNGWYGYFNYGDVMHTYDMSRGEWRYDVGGYAWDNTELGTPAMLWYQFLRTADPEVWIMAEAMTRHCSEVDSYHFGEHKGLGTRHNVSHWGCGAKEARVSEAWWNRFYYYLTADDRTGDVMREVADADTLLYHLDPMRLAQPRSQYPCTAPARLRIGPDWLAYVSNWMTEWERGAQTATDGMSVTDRADIARGMESSPYYNKILTGMKSIAALRHGLFSGPKALGYYPDTGLITNECDSTVLNTNHLMTIMGGFELVNELEPMIQCPDFYSAWLNHAAVYKQNALTISGNHFLIPRLSAYAAWRTGSDRLRTQAWDDLLRHLPLPPSSDASAKPRMQIYTNDCATWTLDAIFMQEVVR